MQKHSSPTIKQLEEAFEQGRSDYVTGAHSPYEDHTPLKDAWQRGKSWEGFLYINCFEDTS